MAEARLAISTTVADRTAEVLRQRIRAQTPGFLPGQRLFPLSLANELGASPTREPVNPEPVEDDEDDDDDPYASYAQLYNGEDDDEEDEDEIAGHARPRIALRPMDVARAGIEGLAEAQIGEDTSADPVPRLDQHHLVPGRLHLARSHQAGEAGADHQQLH